MRTAYQLLALVLCAALIASAEGNSWNRVRYNGGSVTSKVDPKDWNNKLTITADSISLELKDGVKVGIPPKTVTSLSYGQEAHRRVGTMVALAILVAPAALFGLFHKTRLHFIGVQYTGADGKKEGILLQGDKDNYRAILVALQSVTGAPVSVSEKEREFIPVGVTTSVVKEGEEGKPTSGKPPVATGQAEVKGVVQVSSNPPGADIELDGSFVGNAPATLKLAPGKHTIRVTLTGHKEWKREIDVQANSEVQLVANLAKQD
jgi:hypothetical protein